MTKLGIMAVAAANKPAPTQAQMIEAARRCVDELERAHVIGEGMIWDHSRPWKEMAAERIAALTAVGWHDAYSNAVVDLKKVERDTIERCAGELDRLRQHEFGGDDQFAIGFNEAINQAQFRIRALKDKP